MQPSASPPFELGRVLQGAKDVMNCLINAAALLGNQLPGRQIVSAAAVPYDCAQTVVYIAQVTTGSPETRGGAGTYPNPGANMTMYTATYQLAIVRGTATLPVSGVGAQPVEPAAYLTNLTSADSDAATVLYAADLLQNMGFDLGGNAAVPRTVTFGAPQGGLFATSSRVTANI